MCCTDRIRVVSIQSENENLCNPMSRRMLLDMLAEYMTHLQKQYDAHVKKLHEAPATDLSYVAH